MEGRGKTFRKPQPFIFRVFKLPIVYLTLLKIIVVYSFSCPGSCVLYNVIPMLRFFQYVAVYMIRKKSWLPEVD